MIIIIKVLDLVFSTHCVIWTLSRLFVLLSSPFIFCVIQFLFFISNFSINIRVEFPYFAARNAIWTLWRQVVLLSSQSSIFCKTFHLLALEWMDLFFRFIHQFLNREETDVNFMKTKCLTVKSVQFFYLQTHYSACE